MSKKLVIKRAANIAVNVFIYCFLIICLIGVTLTLTSKSDKDGTSTIFGMQMRYVLSPSMEKCDKTDVSGYEIKDIPVNSLVFIETVPEDKAKADAWYDALDEGDVLTFKYVYTRQETITHRITKIEKTNSGYIIELEGDNKNSDSGVLTQVIDTSVDSPNYVIGKVVGQSYPIGLFLSALKTPLGLILIVIIPAMAIMIFEVVKIIKMYSDEKKKKDEDEKAQQQNELDELRRRLAELESDKSASENTEKVEEPNNSNE